MSDQIQPSHRVFETVLAAVRPLAQRTNGSAECTETTLFILDIFRTIIIGFEARGNYSDPYVSDETSDSVWTAVQEICHTSNRWDLELKFFAVQAEVTGAE